MTNAIRPYARRVHILTALAKHGPMTTRCLNQLLKEPMQPRRLRDALKRLHDARLVTKRFDRIFRGSGVYYQITQDKSYWNQIGSLISVSPESLWQPQFRHAELIHSEACAVWSEKLKHLFQNSQVIRDFDFKKNSTAVRALLSKNDDLELKPDLLIITPPAGNVPGATVAVEIEKHQKSSKRLILKLKKYASRTLLDGIIYFCDLEFISEKLRLVYNSNVLMGALRVNHYGNNFILFSDGSRNPFNQELKMFNAALEPVKIIDWMNYLVKTNPRMRRDSMLQQSAV